MNASSKLHELLKANDFNGVAALLKYYSDVDPTNSEESAVQVLVNRRNDQKYTALHIAIFSRNLAAVKLLVEYGADINAKCHGIPCIHLALSSAVLPQGGVFGRECFSYFKDHPSTDLSCRVIS